MAELGWNIGDTLTVASGRGEQLALKRVDRREPFDGEVSTVPWSVVEVSVIEYPMLRVRFQDGTEGRVVMTPDCMRGVFEPLRDPEFFAQVSVELGAVTWPGELDLAPDAMYYEIKRNGEWIIH
ncbi:MAG: DUF2442 domain-containing protein [Gammaproteobacteria bacterium]|nr:DUF2442 domain-containing protein [Gammaproteobacteria bacterium]